MELFPTLIRHEHPAGPVTYRSPLLGAMGVAHAFTTKLGGVSGPGGDAMDLNDPAHLSENIHRLRAAIGVENRSTVLVSQVHGSGVHVPENFHDKREADAIVCGDPAAMLVIRVADCVPILLAGPGGRVVAAIHAGWRGIVAGVIERTLEAMLQRVDAELRVAPYQVTAAIGPCIGVHRFEVGPEVVDAFNARGLGVAVNRTLGPKAHINLPLACATLLRLQGVRGKNIDTTDRCTYRDADEFYSYRRDSGRTGRLAAVICASPALGGPPCP